MKKVYIWTGIAIGVCVVMAVLLYFSTEAMPETIPGYEHLFNTGNIWYNIVNVAFLVLAAAVLLLPIMIIIVRATASIKEKIRIKKLDIMRDKRIKEELRLIREREAAAAKSNEQNVE